MDNGACNDLSEEAAGEQGVMARLDAYGARHPGLMLAATALAAIVATLTLLSQEYGAVVLYQAF